MIGRRRPALQPGSRPGPVAFTYNKWKPNCKKLEETFTYLHLLARCLSTIGLQDTVSSLCFLHCTVSWQQRDVVHGGASKLLSWRVWGKTPPLKMGQESNYRKMLCKYHRFNEEKLHFHSHSLHNCEIGYKFVERRPRICYRSVNIMKTIQCVCTQVLQSHGETIDNSKCCKLRSTGLWGEWPSCLWSLRQVTEVKLGRVRSNSGWVTLEAWPSNSPRRPSEGMLN